MNKLHHILTSCYSIKQLISRHVRGWDNEIEVYLNRSSFIVNNPRLITLWYSSLISSGEYWNINNPHLITLWYSSLISSGEYWNINNPRLITLWYSSLISSGEYWNINNPRLITLQYSSRVESIVTWSAVGFWQWSSSRHYKLIWTLLHCLYLFILMSSMFSNLLIIMIGSISSVYEYCLSAGYGQFHTFIPSVLLIFYISGANTSFTGNTILHNTDSNLCLNYFIELLIYIMRFSHCVCS
jgi:hypothetical protein